MKRILIVDDEANVTRVLKLMLERAGHAVRTAPDGEAGLASVLAEPPDAVITDIQMPRMDGRQLVRAIHERLPERRFPIFVMTSMTAREEREWVSKIARVEFLEKPVSPRQLVGRLAQSFADAAGATGSTP
jgi:CheY-like chemotaxis protein